MEDKIILKFKTKNILNFYEIEPRTKSNFVLSERMVSYVFTFLILYYLYILHLNL